MDGAVAQRSEQSAHNRPRVGSNPTRPTRQHSSGRGRKTPYEIGEASEVEVYAAQSNSGGQHRRSVWATVSGLLTDSVLC